MYTWCSYIALTKFRFSENFILLDIIIVLFTNSPGGPGFPGCPFGPLSPVIPVSPFIPLIPGCPGLPCTTITDQPSIHSIITNTHRWSCRSNWSRKTLLTSISLENIYTLLSTRAKRFIEPLFHLVREKVLLSQRNQEAVSVESFEWVVYYYYTCYGVTLWYRLTAGGPGSPAWPCGPCLPGIPWRWLWAWYTTTGFFGDFYLTFLPTSPSFPSLPSNPGLP